MGNTNGVPIKEKKTLKDWCLTLRCVLVLKDGRILSCSDDSKLRVYDPNKGYKLKIIISGHRESVFSACQLENDDIVSCSMDKTLKIWSLTQDSYKLKFNINFAHTNIISKVITLSNNRFASCCYDRCIKIWKSNEPYSAQPIKVLNGTVSMIQLKNQEILVGSQAITLCLWSLSTYQTITQIKEVKTFHPNDLYQIDDNRIISGDTQTIQLVNIKKCYIENTYFFPFSNYIYSFLYLKDGKILCGGEKTFWLYDVSTYELKPVHSSHTNGISCITRINENMFCTCSFDGKIKIYKY